MNTTAEKVMACIDGSALTEAVCDYAAWIAGRIEAPLQLLHTINHHQETADAFDLSGNIGIDSRDQLLQEIARLEQQQNKLRMQQGKLLLDSAKQRVVDAGIKEPISNQRHGSLVESLIELEEDIRVLVVGLRGKVHENRPDKIGAKLESIIRSLHKPVLVVNGPFQAPKRIMIAYDGSKAAEKAVAMVATSPLFKGLNCHLVYAGNDDNSSAMLDLAADWLRKIEGIELTVSKLEGKAEQALCNYQENNGIDLVVMGAFSHTRLHDLLLGSFTAKMLLQTQTPLLLLRR